MKFLSGNILLLAMCVALSVVVAMPGSSFAEDQARLRSWEDGGDHLDDPMIRLRDQISKDTDLSDAEMSWYAPLIESTLKLNGGEGEPVRAMFQKAVEDGCVGDCLMERLRRWNRVMKQEQKQQDGEDQVAARGRTGGDAGDQTQARTRDDEDCDPVGDANKNRNGDEAGDQTGDLTGSEAGSESGDQDQTRTRDDEDGDPVGDANKNRKGG